MNTVRDGMFRKVDFDTNIFAGGDGQNLQNACQTIGNITVFMCCIGDGDGDVRRWRWVMKAWMEDGAWTCMNMSSVDRLKGTNTDDSSLKSLDSHM